MLSHGSGRRLIFMSVVLLLFWLCLGTVLQTNLGSSHRIFNDYYDRWDYFQIGGWLPAHAAPYRDVMSEYPQIPTSLFGILRLPFLNDPETSVAFMNYSMLFAFVMICLYICLVYMLNRMLTDEKKGLILALLLPAPLYFAYNRFDVLPALIVLFALLMLQEEQWELAGILLAVGTLTKWYPGLLLVPVTKYLIAKRLPARRIRLFVGLFCVSCLALLAPTYLTGGLKAVFIPYAFHAKRGFDLSALPALVEPLTNHVFPLHDETTREIVFLLLQIAVLPIVAFARLDSFKDLLCWCLLTISNYMLFSRIYSPQWLLWILPFMILLAQDPIDTVSIIVYGTITYVEYPIFYIDIGPDRLVEGLIGWMNVILLVWIIIRALGQLISFRKEMSTALTQLPLQDSDSL